MSNRCFASIATLAAMGVVLLLTPGSAAGQASSPIAKAITAKTSTAVRAGPGPVQARLESADVNRCRSCREDYSRDA